MSHNSRVFTVPGGVHNATPSRIVFGPGSVRRIADEIDLLRAERVLLVATPGRVGLAEEIGRAIGSRVCGILPEAVSQVPIEVAQRGRAVARSLGADCLVSVGGGAATGLSKAIALEHPLRIIAIPTTYSGSEMTGFCGITSNGVKRMNASLNMLATTVIYDAELTLALPTRTTAASAMNALAHCIDALCQPTLSPLIRHAAVEGARITMQALPTVMTAPNNLEARSELLYGAFLAGGALAGGFGLQHAIAHTLGGSYSIEHGTAHAVVLPYVVRYLMKTAPEEMLLISKAIDSDDLFHSLMDLLEQARLPQTLADIAVQAADVEKIVEITVGEDPDRSGPVQITSEVVRSILQDALNGCEAVA